MADMNIDLAISESFGITNLLSACLYKAVRRLPVDFLIIVSTMGLKPSPSGETFRFFCFS